MAEENPHIEIKKVEKPITNTRKQYLMDTKDNIIGPPGFCFRIYPTLKERLALITKEQKENFQRNKKLCKHLSLADLSPKNIKNKDTQINNLKFNVSKFQKTRHKLVQPILRFRYRTDLERICDEVNNYAKPEEKKILKEIHEHQVNLIDFPKRKRKYSGLKSTQEIINDILNQYNMGKNMIPNNYENNLEGIRIPKNNDVIYTRLKDLNESAKKIRSDLHFKTHFKGVESIYINPRQIYQAVKKPKNYETEKKSNFSYDDNMIIENIEKKNEYKDDIKYLISEEKNKQKLVNSKEFLNYLNNKKYFDEIINNRKGKTIENKNEKLEKLYKINYLKKLAFDNLENKIYQNNNNSVENNTYSESSYDINEHKGSNQNDEQEIKIKIGKKVYHMRSQMKIIAKEILNKCKFHTLKKESEEKS